jgi:hypothetical protein
MWECYFKKSPKLHWGSKCPSETYGQRNRQFNRNLAGISIKLLTPHGTLVCCKNCQNYNFLSMHLGLFACLSCQKENSVFRRKEKVHAWTFYHNIPPWFLSCVVCTQTMFPKHQYIYSPLCRWYLYARHKTQRELCSQQLQRNLPR